MYATKLTSVRGFSTNNIIFSKPEVGSIPGSVPKISFKRIRIGVRHPDGSTGDLILETPDHLFSFGLQENRDMGTGNINGYVMPFCLWNKNGATEEEMEFTRIFDSVVQRCKDHLLQYKDDIERYDLDMADLKNLNPLYWKKDKGKIVEGTGPVLYIKTMMSKKTESISTVFINGQTHEEMDPQEVMNKYCFAKGAIKFESVFVGNKISLQIKLYEALVEPVDTERKTLLTSHVIRKVDTTSNDIYDALAAEAEPITTPNNEHEEEEEEGEGDAGDDNEEEEENETGSLGYDHDLTPHAPPNTPIVEPIEPVMTPPPQPLPATPPAPKRRGRKPVAVAN
jgi:hypothetical protein